MDLEPVKPLGPLILHLDGGHLRPAGTSPRELDKGLDSLRLTLEDRLDRPFRRIADPSVHPGRFGTPPHGVPKEHSLNPSTDHTRRRTLIALATDVPGDCARPGASSGPYSSSSYSDA